MPVPIGEFTLRNATPSELRKWEKYIYLDENKNIMLSEVGFSLFQCRMSLKDYEKEFRMIVRTLSKRKTIGEVNLKEVIRYSGDVDIPVRLKEKNWLPYDPSVVILRNKYFESVLVDWIGHVFIDESCQKVKLTRLGEKVLLGGSDETFQEIVAYLLMKAQGALNIDSPSRMESLQLMELGTSVKQLSVELLPPRSVTILGKTTEKPAIVQLRPLFYFKSPVAIEKPLRSTHGISISG